MKSNQDLNERLKKYPDLASQFEAFLDIIESEKREMYNANNAEKATVDQVQRLGKKVLQEWAERKEKALSKEVPEQIAPVKRNGKKNFIG